MSSHSNKSSMKHAADNDSDNDFMKSKTSKVKSTPVKSRQKNRQKATISGKIIVNYAIPISSKLRNVATQTSNLITNQNPVTPAKRTFSQDDRSN